MYNQDILNKIEAQYGTQKAAEFCEIASLMYDIKFNACKEDDENHHPLRAEYDYERDWWMEASIGLKQKQLCSPKNS